MIDCTPRWHSDVQMAPIHPVTLYITLPAMLNYLPAVLQSKQDAASHKACLLDMSVYCCMWSDGQ
jgi:hypothetical protein